MAARAACMLEYWWHYWPSVDRLGWIQADQYVDVRSIDRATTDSFVHPEQSVDENRLGSDAGYRDIGVPV